MNDLSKLYHIELENVPSELKKYDNFLIWQGYKKENGKIDKPPMYYDPKRGKWKNAKIDITYSYQKAVKIMDQHPNECGIGFQLSGSPFVAFDLDDCFQKKALREEAKRIVKMTHPTYIEYSPSGNGLRIFVKCEGYKAKINKRVIDENYALEMYAENRYVTLTGRRYDNLPLENPDQINEVSPELLDEIQTKYFKQKKFHKKEERNGSAAQTGKSFLSDETVMKRIGDKGHSDLLNGNISQYDDDHSKADLALCNQLAFWTNKDIEQMDRIFRQTGLMRDKWDKVHRASDNATYGQMTIEKAIEGTESTYQPVYSKETTTDETDEKERYQKQESEDDEPEGYFIDIYGNFCYGFMKETQNDEKYIKMTLANFVVTPIREIIKDGDINDIERYFEFAGTLNDGTPLPNAIVKAEDFPSLSWITKEWGLSANTKPGNSVKDRLRNGIQSIALHIPKHFIYTHTGWREAVTKDGEKVYTFLVNGSDIAKNNIEVELEDSLEDFYQFVEDDISLQDAFQYSMKLLRSAPLKITAPLAGATFTAPLNPIMEKSIIGKMSHIVWLQGRSRSLKSVLSSFFGNHYSEKWNRKNFPAGFDDTYYSIEKKLHYAKDVLMVVDDYYPAKTKAEADKMDSVAQKLIRSGGNGKGKGRLTNTLESRKEFDPRCSIVVTGEQLPNVGESDLFRMFVVNIERGQANSKELKELAHHRKELNIVGREYIKWLASNYERIEVDLLQKVERIIRKFEKDYEVEQDGIEHCTHLFVGLYAFFMFALEKGCLSESEFHKLTAKSMKVLSESANEQHDNEIAVVNPTDMFAEAIDELIGTNQIALKPADPYDINNKVIGGKFAKEVGYYDKSYFYFYPKTIYQAVQKFYYDQGINFPLKQRALNKALAEDGKIKTYGSQKQNTVPVSGRKGRFIAFYRFAVSPVEDHKEEKEDFDYQASHEKQMKIAKDIEARMKE